MSRPSCAVSENVFACVFCMFCQVDKHGVYFLCVSVTRSVPCVFICISGESEHVIVRACVCLLCILSELVCVGRFWPSLHA
ncbi:hypothetical protein FKM82_014161 [Ascaphus truei]